MSTYYVRFFPVRELSSWCVRFYTQNTSNARVALQNSSCSFWIPFLDDFLINEYRKVCTWFKSKLPTIFDRCVSMNGDKLFSMKIGFNKIIIDSWRLSPSERTFYRFHRDLILSTGNKHSCIENGLNRIQILALPCLWCWACPSQKIRVGQKSPFAISKRKLRIAESIR